MREVKTYYGDYKLNDHIAQIIGIKVEDYYYKSITEGQNTIFTAPPQFDIANWAVNYLKNYAEKFGVTLINSNNPREIALDFIDKFNHVQR